MTINQQDARKKQAARKGETLTSWEETLIDLNKVTEGKYDEADAPQQVEIKNAWEANANLAGFLQTIVPPNVSVRIQGDHVFNDFIGDFLQISNAGTPPLHLIVPPPRIADHYRRLKVTYSNTGTTNADAYGQAKKRASEAIETLRTQPTKKNIAQVRTALQNMLDNAIDMEACQTIQTKGTEIQKEAVNNTLNYKARLTVDLLLSNFCI